MSRRGPTPPTGPLDLGKTHISRKDITTTLAKVQRAREGGSPCEGEGAQQARADGQGRVAGAWPPHLGNRNTHHSKLSNLRPLNRSIRCIGTGIRARRCMNAMQVAFIVSAHSSKSHEGINLAVYLAARLSLAGEVILHRSRRGGGGRLLPSMPMTRDAQPFHAPRAFTF
jgi:hypothetical protein